MNIEKIVSEQLWLAIKGTYDKDNYSGAILDSLHFLADVIREKSGLESDGVALVNEAFGGKNPKIKMNKLRTTTEENIQKGTCDILRGIYTSIRNPRSHKKHVDTVDDAYSIILFVDYLYRQIHKAKSLFSVERFVEKVIDKRFVASKQYAKLLVDEIPSNKIYDVLINVYDEKNNGDYKKLKYFFSAIFQRLKEEEILDFYAALSEELMTTDIDNDFSAVLRLLPFDKWELISLTARLRTENAIIESIEDGKARSRGVIGGLGTFASRGVYKRFHMKDIVYETLHKKLLVTEEESVDYLITYFWNDLTELVDGKFADGFIKGVRAHLSSYFAPCSIYDKMILEGVNEEGNIWYDTFQDDIIEYDRIHDGDLPF